MVIVTFQAFADRPSSRGGIVELQCVPSPVHLVESAAPSGSSQLIFLHSSMNFESRN